MTNETEIPDGPWNNKSLLAEFREAIVTDHNIRRVDHGSGPLKLNPKLNNYAQEWAELNADIEQSTHRPDDDLIYGESLHRIYWTSTPVDVMARLICNDFYSEIAQYKFGVGSVNDVAEVNHFTQMVWYDTTELGVGIARGVSGFVYCVINYNPKGNIDGEYCANVFPAGTKYIPNRREQFIPPSVRHLPNYSTINHFRKFLLNEHNLIRKNHRVPYLQISDHLNQVAQDWAIRLAQRDCLEHSSTPCYGENIYMIVTTDPDLYPKVKEIAEELLDGSEGYNYDQENDICTAGHFTQVIWKNTREIGIGMQKAIKGNVYVVVNYFPRGNIVGEFLANVLPPKDTKPLI